MEGGKWQVNDEAQENLGRSWSSWVVQDKNDDNEEINKR